MKSYIFSIFGTIIIAIALPFCYTELASITRTSRNFLSKVYRSAPFSYTVDQTFKTYTLNPIGIAKPSLLARMSSSQISADFPGLPVVPPSDPSLTQANDKATPRKIVKSFLAREQAEGAGATVRRSIGTPSLRNFSPFLMLDHFSVSPPAGFPDHPHRGQETITYLIDGAVDHEDFAGNKGTIWPGDLQFMTAGRGIMHAEMPRASPDGKDVVGMQLWVDLPKHLKQCEPRYRDLKAKEIPSVKVDDDKVEVKIISGQSHGVDSVQELAYTPVWLLDIKIQPGGRIEQRLPKAWNAFAYVLKGQSIFGKPDAARVIDQYHIAVFEQDGDSIIASVSEDATEPAQFILVAGTPLDQKVVQYGPFVLNSQEEVRQTINDFYGFSNGFERARDWQSEIGKAH